MQKRHVTLNIPPEADFARSVRMLAANLGVVCSFSVDDVEDLRMAAEEGFVYACATKPESCAVTFDLSDGTVEITYSLGYADASEDEAIAYADLLLAALCDDYEIDAPANSWTRAIDAAAKAGRTGEVVVLAASALQGAWADVPPAHFAHLVAALVAVGRGHEARMIVAEAVMRA